MKLRIFLIGLIILFLSTEIFATLSRVKSLGDVENPVDARISGLIKDDIVDIYFNPAKVNEVNALLIISSFNLDYGADGDEYREEYSVTESAQVIKTLKKTTQKSYDFNFNTGILIPLKVFNIFLNYDPNWHKFYSETSTSEVISGLTNLISDSITKEKELRMSPTAFDVTMGFNLKDKILLGLRGGYCHSEYNRYYEQNNIQDQKSDYSSDRFLLGSGIEFNFTKKIALSIAGDFTFSQKDEFPLTLEEISGTNDFNYDKNKKIFNYSFTVKEANYGLRIYPEIKLENERFYRILLGINYYNYTKSYRFNPLGDFSNLAIKDFNKDQIILSSGISYNYNFTSSIKAVYGLKYISIIWGNESKVKMPDNTDIEIDKKDHFAGGFAGFDAKVSPMVYIRVGISQGFYRYFKQLNKESNKSTGDTTETETVSHQILPQTVFTLGIYVQPVTDLIFELNLLATKSDWQMENISFSEQTIKENGEEKLRVKQENYNFQFGLTVSYKI